VSWLLLTKLVLSILPWSCRFFGSVVQNATLVWRNWWSKFDPVMVIVTSELPACALAGEIEVIDGDEAEADVTLNVTELEVASGTSPIKSQISTRTLAWRGLSKRGAGRIAVNCELLTKVVSKAVSVPLAVHTTRLNLWSALVNENCCVAVTISVSRVADGRAGW